MAAGSLPPGDIKWLSPLETDEFAEYRDDAFLGLLGVQLKDRCLESFWPRRGPQWDSLARLSKGGVMLIEAKANLAELVSPASQAHPDSARLIRASLEEAKAAFGAPPAANWMGAYYQYANRLAHLYLLRQCNRIDTYLVFLYFIGATEVQGPTRREEWLQPIHDAHRALQLGNGPLTPFVADVFIDVAELAAA